MTGRSWRALAGWVALSFVPAAIGAPFPAPSWYRRPVQLALNAAWTPIFFGLRRPGLALAEIVATLGAVAVTVALFLRERTLAGLLLLPYLAWTAFATLLNAAIWRRNRELG